jgi:beta-glucosidase
MGYAPWSEGLGLVLRRLHDELPDRPLLVCEHGVGTDDDTWRCDVLRESLAVTEEAVADGVDLRGFFFWTGVDNYEWTFGYDVAFGLFDRDRQARPSAELAAEHARG